MAILLSFVRAVLRGLAAALQTRRHLVLENFALRRQLHTILENYFEYYHHSDPHRALIQDRPVPRPVMTPEQGSVIEFPQVGGLHHLYTRKAA